MTKLRIYSMSFGSVYPLYVAKAERKGRTKAEVDEIIGWLTGYSTEEVGRLAAGTGGREGVSAAEEAGGRDGGVRGLWRRSIWRRFSLGRHGSIRRGG